eukprot:7391504-Prymnesium_polylepis.3
MSDAGMDSESSRGVACASGASGSGCAANAPSSEGVAGPRCFRKSGHFIGETATAASLADPKISPCSATRPYVGSMRPKPL